MSVCHAAAEHKSVDTDASDLVPLRRLSERKSNNYLFRVGTWRSLPNTSAAQKTIAATLALERALALMSKITPENFPSHFSAMALAFPTPYGVS